MGDNAKLIALVAERGVGAVGRDSDDVDVLAGFALVDADRRAESIAELPGEIIGDLSNLRPVGLDQYGHGVLEFERAFGQLHLRGLRDDCRGRCVNRLSIRREG